MRRLNWPLVAAVLAIMAIGFGIGRLHHAQAGVVREAVLIGHIPATIYHAEGGGRRPVVVIAHGFAGSQQLMQSFALAFARNGYVAVTFDFAGHARNPSPMTGDVTKVTGTTRVLVSELRRVAEHAKALGDGRLAVLGHSMASDIVVRFAQEFPGVEATIAVSMFSPAVTAMTPRNLLVIVGDWEGALKREALRAVGLATAPDPAIAATTYGEFAEGSARRAVFSRGVEHVGVLFSRDSLSESVDWLDRTFGIARSLPPRIDARGPAILVLLAGSLVLAWPLSRLLPRIADPPLGASLPWRQLLPVAAAAMLLTPLVLRVVPTHFLPVVVGDYLAVHFLIYGAITAICLRWLRHLPAPHAARNRDRRRVGGFAAATLGMIAYFFAGVAWPIDMTFTSFVPNGQRGLLIGVMLIGSSSYFLADEWLTRGAGAPRGAYLVSKLAFLLSLVIAVALDVERLFFLVLIVPLMVLFFIVHGLFSHWVYRRTGHPLVAACGNALACAWAIGVTFPLLAG
jgi:dienelactone hydrolase